MMNNSDSISKGTISNYKSRFRLARRKLAAKSGDVRQELVTLHTDGGGGGGGGGGKSSSAKSPMLARSLSNYSAVTATNGIGGGGGGDDSTSGTRKLKMVLIGDSCTGKSTLVGLYLNRLYEARYRPTIVDDYEGAPQTRFF